MTVLDDIAVAGARPYRFGVLGQSIAYTQTGGTPAPVWYMAGPALCIPTWWNSRERTTPAGSTAITCIVQRSDGGRKYLESALIAVKPIEIIISTDSADTEYGGVADPKPNDSFVLGGDTYVVDSVRVNHGEAILKALLVDEALAQITVNVEEGTWTADGYGGNTPAWATLITSAKVILDPVAVEAHAEGRSVTELTHRMFVPYSQAANVTELINYSFGDTDQTSLRVKYVDGSRTRYFHVVAAYDLAEQKRMIRANLIEREAAWWN